MPDLTPPQTTKTDRAQLLVDGKVYDGWLSFSIVRSMEAPSGTFNLTVSDRWPGQSEPWPITEGAECQLNLGDEPLIIGYIDNVQYSLSGEDRSLSVSGRDKAGDLVDCSYIDKPDQWREAKVSEIAADLGKPFGVKVTMAAKEDSTVANFKIEPGEKAYDALARLLKLKGLYAWPDGNGGVTIGATEFESLKITIDQTQCINISATRDATERFSDYLVKGQRPTNKAAKDPTQGKAASQVKDEAKDPDVKRYRPLMVVSEGAGAEAQERALWEAAVRAGKALQVEIVLQGYRPDKDSPVWALGKTFKITAKSIALEAELLITQVKFDLADNSGHTTTLSLTRPDAFLPEPVKEGQGQGGTSGGLPAGSGLPPGTVVYS
jgi:prophage tail gpP-like protein